MNVVRASDFLFQLQTEQLAADSPGTFPSIGEFHSLKHLSGQDWAKAKCQSVRLFSHPLYVETLGEAISSWII